MRRLCTQQPATCGPSHCATRGRYTCPHTNNALSATVSLPFSLVPGKLGDTSGGRRGEEIRFPRKYRLITTGWERYRGERKLPERAVGRSWFLLLRTTTTTATMNINSSRDSRIRMTDIIFRAFQSRSNYDSLLKLRKT